MSVYLATLYVHPLSVFLYSVSCHEMTGTSDNICLFYFLCTVSFCEMLSWSWLPRWNEIVGSKVFLMLMFTLGYQWGGMGETIFSSMLFSEQYKKTTFL